MNGMLNHFLIQNSRFCKYIILFRYYNNKEDPLLV